MPTTSEKLNPIHRLLKSPFVYSLTKNFLLKKGTSEFLYRDFPKFSQEDKVLDLGCGPAKIRKWIKAKHYVGIDFNPAHIKEAKMNCPNDTFICDDIASHSFNDDVKFDKILMMGVLHHLNDQEATNVLSACQKLLAEDGKIIALDPLFERGQNPIAKLLAKLDQGNFVRTREEYLKLAQAYFSRVEVVVKTDLLRLPYTHHIMAIQR